MAQYSKLSKIKKGEYFKFKGKKKIYIFDGGGQVRGFRYTGVNDINDHHSTKSDRAIEIGLTY